VMLVRLAREMVDHGYTRIGMKHLFEVLRWRVAIATKISDDYYQPEGRPLKLSNSHTSRYARLIMMQEPGLLDCFGTRALRTKRIAVIDPLAPGEQASLGL
jgi:hypothetical protein